MTLDEILPQTGKMRLLDEVLAFEGETIRLALVVRSDGLFNDPALGGDVPAYVGVEYMAQAVAAHMGATRLRNKESKRAGFLVGTRLYESNVDSFQPGLRLTASATCLLLSIEGLGVYDCVLEGAGVSARAKVNGFLPKDDETFWSTVAGPS